MNNEMRLYLKLIEKHLNFITNAVCFIMIEVLLVLIVNVYK